MADSPIQDDDEPKAPEDAADPAIEEEDVARFQFRLSKTLTRRIDQYLTDRVPYLSRAGVQRLIEEGLVKVNGRVIKASYRPREGDQIEMVAPPEPVNEIVPENIPLDVVYEDEHFLALNKQANLMVHPARGKWTGTLVNGLIFYGSKWSEVNGAWRPGILHRLDRNTTGIMLVAKSDEAHWRIARQFENRTIQKTYIAIAEGVPEYPSDVIDLPIGRDLYKRERQAIRKESNGGRTAVTRYDVLETFHTLEPQSSRRDFSFIKLTPKTGRTHQLRVHLAARGHPLVGDDMYGGKAFVRGDFRFERQALHAAEITLVHPGTLQQITIAAPLPADINTLLGYLRSENTPPGDRR